MKTPLINDKVNNALNKLIQKLFGGNRLLDRIMSQLSVKFVMNKTSATLHPLLAHAFPLLADVVGDYQDNRNAQTVYMETPTDDTDYKTPVEIFDAFVKYMIELEKLIIDTMAVAVKENDTMTRVFLDHFLIRISKYTAQAVLLADKAAAYGPDWMIFDHNIEDFLIVEPFTK